MLDICFMERKINQVLSFNCSQVLLTREEVYGSPPEMLGCQITVFMPSPGIAKYFVARQEKQHLSSLLRAVKFRETHQLYTDNKYCQYSPVYFSPQGFVTFVTTRSRAFNCNCSYLRYLLLYSSDGRNVKISESCS